MLIPAALIKNPEVRALADEAESFVASHAWCDEVTSVNLAWAVAGVLGVFEVKLTPSRPDVDSILWVVVGDIPPAYLVKDEAPTWKEALEGYILEMRRWVDAVKQELPLDDVIPVEAAPTTEHADMLASRLNFIQAEILESGKDEIEPDT